MTVGQALASNDLSGSIAGTYASSPIGAMVAPLLVGLLADRFFASQKIACVLFALSGGFLLLMPQAGAAGNGSQLILLATIHMILFMPTIGLLNGISFSHLSADEFPKTRVWGTIGWIVSGITVAALGVGSSFTIFQIGGGAQLLTAAVCLVLPHTEPGSKGKAVAWRDLFMLDAWGLLRSRSFFVFLAASTLLCVPLSFYYSLASVFLSNAGFLEPAAFLSLGQVSEVVFLLLIPFFFRRLGVKWMLSIGMLAWITRYLCFAFGAPDEVVILLAIGVILHGICYDFFFVTGFMYTETAAPPALRNQAQGILVFLTQGLGMFIGYRVAGHFFAERVPSHESFTQALPERSSASTDASLLERFGRTPLPDEVPTDLHQTLLNEWSQLWLIPAGIACFALVLFILFFRSTPKQTAE